MHVPGLLERVHITGLGEVFLVTGVNEAEQVADLLPIVYGQRPFLSVPFTFMESIPGCGPLNKYLNDRFEGDLNRKKYKPFSICPLVSMSIASLERCMKELRIRQFSEVLQQRIKANRDMIWTFEMASKYVGRGPARNLPEHSAILHKYSEEMIAGLGLHD
jgi:hypothetical protein